MLHKLAVIICLVFGLVLPAAAAKHDKRRQPEPCPPPPPCAKPKPDLNYEVRITSIDARESALPVIETILASTSNRDDQRSRLQDQVKAGVSILQITYGPTIRVPQEEVRTSETADCRVTARPHLDARCAEAVDLFVEQNAGTQNALVASGSPVFENGDTRLLSRTLRSDGTAHLLYATVFFPPYQPALSVCK